MIPWRCGDPIAAAVMDLAAGRIVAVNGLGGCHLARDACNRLAFDLLRARKLRPGKPLALMRDKAMIARYMRLGAAELAPLCDAAAPRWFCRKRRERNCPEAAAPGMATLGWMLPYIPLHHLLLDAFGVPLVMTSGNLSGERRLDDSVMRADLPMILRCAPGADAGGFALCPMGLARSRMWIPMVRS